MLSLETSFDIPNCVLDHLSQSFSSDDPAIPSSVPIHRNELMKIDGTGERKKQIKVVALNAARLFSECGDVNIVHAIATMTVDSLLIRQQLAPKERLSTEQFFKDLSEASSRLAENEEYEPVINCVKQFLSDCEGSDVSLDTAKKVVTSFLVGACQNGVPTDIRDTFIFGALAGTAFASAIGTFFQPAYLIALSCLITSIVACFKTDSMEEEAKKITRIGNYCALFSQMKNFLSNRPNYVGKTNVCVIAFDDLSDFMLKDSSVFSFFKFKCSSSQTPFHNAGGMCDFLLMDGSDGLAPTFKDYRSTEGRDMYGFYKEVFEHLNTARTVEDLLAVKDLLQNPTSPEMVSSIERKKRKLMEDSDATR